MTVKQSENQKVLARRISVRQAFVEMIVNVVVMLVEKRGTVLSREEYANHIKTKAELKNFSHFSFYTCGPYTSEGGRLVRVWFHPDSEGTTRAPVFEVEFWNSKQCSVRRFDQSVPWQSAMRKLISKRKGTFATPRRKQQAAVAPRDLGS